VSKRPWLKWYPSDWRSEPSLRMCSRAARSLWVDLIGLMHDAEPYGHLLINGKAPTTKQLAAILGDSEKELKNLLVELENAGVFSKNEAGVITSRRMVRDEEKARQDANNGKRGGNPRVKGGVNPSDNGGDKAQMPEARCQDLKPYSKALSRRLRAAAQTQAAAPPVASPDWADEIPEWAAFKSKTDPAEWNAWFTRLRPNGSIASLVANSNFERDKLTEKFLPRLQAHFGPDFVLKTKTEKEATR
jgi:hypothetical protein